MGEQIFASTLKFLLYSFFVEIINSSFYYKVFICRSFFPRKWLSSVLCSGWCNFMCCKSVEKSFFHKFLFFPALACFQSTTLVQTNTAAIFLSHEINFSARFHLGKFSRNQTERARSSIKAFLVFSPPTYAHILLTDFIVFFSTFFIAQSKSPAI